MLIVYSAQLEYGEFPNEYEHIIDLGLFTTYALACSAVESALRVPHKLTFVLDDECPGIWGVDFAKDAGSFWLPLREDYKGPSVASVWATEVWEDLEHFKPWWMSAKPSEKEGVR